MAKSIPSHAVPAMLKWARERARMSVEHVASAEQVDATRLLEWESGKVMISYAQLRSLSARYKFPMHVFYLSEPPKDFAPVRDFRTLPSGHKAEFSPELALAIRRAQERQEWIANYIDESQSSPEKLFKDNPDGLNAGRVAHRIRAALGVTMQMQEDCRPEQSFSMWRKAVESLGVFVFQAQGVEVDEMRGCALPHPIAPVILVNSKDATTAKVFTLIHELAHLWLGESAVTAGNPRYHFEIAPEKGTEMFCNQVAGETLVPERDLLPLIPKNWERRSDETLEKLARLFGVSRAVIAYRLVDTGQATDEWLSSKMRHLRTPARESKEGSPPQHTLMLSRFGERFARLAVAALYEGEIHGGSFKSLSEMDIKYLPSLESSLFRSVVVPGKE